MEGLHRTVSDLSYELRKEAKEVIDDAKLPPINEVEDAKCECCGMSEECTPEYIQRVKDKYSGKLICGLCAEAVKEEIEKNGGKREEALNAHMNVCVRFNKFGRTHPVLYQAEAMREMLRKSASLGARVRAQSISPRDRGDVKKNGIMRSSSCIPAITRDMTDRKAIN
ncbi:Duf1677 family protein [Thalictrum thalictroides]|uniref:Duf1677 family protein n=1 Tax=Thalictrum thalictroides TaxID=46969 RepID=A0A7J6V8U8_THATH|nr:Duf1677 family protein [Thalictrum thalictroides]